MKRSHERLVASSVLEYAKVLGFDPDATTSGSAADTPAKRRAELASRNTAANALVTDAELVLRTVVQEAQKHARHAKRRRLTTQDVDSALRARGMAPLLGFFPSYPAELAVTAGKGSEAGRVLAADRRVDLGGNGSSSSSTGVASTLGTGGGGGDDGDHLPLRKGNKLLRLNELADASLPRVPLAASLQSHWLALGSVQPRIVENPGAPNTAPVSVPGSGKALLLAGSLGAVGLENPSSSSSSSSAGGGAAGGALGGGSVAGTPTLLTIKGVATHGLTKEMQLLFDRVTAAVRTGAHDPAMRAAVLLSVRADAGLQQLVPYLVRFIATDTRTALSPARRDLPRLSALVALTSAMLGNEGLDLEPYLHVLLPAVLSVLLAKKISAETEDHWSVRDAAATLVGGIVRRFGGSYVDLRPRLTKTLHQALVDPKRPLTTRYGAVAGVAALGSRAVEVLLMPVVRPLVLSLRRVMREGNDNDNDNDVGELQGEGTGKEKGKSDGSGDAEGEGEGGKEKTENGEVAGKGDGEMEVAAAADVEMRDADAGAAEAGTEGKENGAAKEKAEKKKKKKKKKGTSAVKRLQARLLYDLVLSVVGSVLVERIVMDAGAAEAAAAAAAPKAESVDGTAKVGSMGSTSTAVVMVNTAVELFGEAVQPFIEKALAIVAREDEGDGVVL